MAFFINSSFFSVELRDPYNASCVGTDEQVNVGNLTNCVSLYLFRNPKNHKMGTFFCREAAGHKWTFLDLALARATESFAFQQTNSDYVISYDSDFELYSDFQCAIEFIQPDRCRIFNWWTNHPYPGLSQPVINFYSITRTKDRLIFCEIHSASDARCNPPDKMSLSFATPPKGFVINKNLYLIDEGNVLLMNAAKLFKAYSGDRLIEIEYQTFSLKSMFDCRTKSRLVISFSPIATIIILVILVVLCVCCCISLKKKKTKKKQASRNFQQQSNLSTSTDSKITKTDKEEIKHFKMEKNCKLFTKITI